MRSILNITVQHQLYALGINVIFKELMAKLLAYCFMTSVTRQHIVYYTEIYLHIVYHFVSEKDTRYKLRRLQIILDRNICPYICLRPDLIA